VREGDLVVGRFEIERRAGVGGMATVYRAHDRQTGGIVALKIVQGPSVYIVERMTREARVLAELRHPGIVRYVSHGDAGDDSFYLAMEWLDGQDLGSRLDRGALSLSDAIAVARRVASALGAAHARGVVHRDIKPANVILRGGRADDAVLLDFGVARVTRASLVATQSGGIIGTPGYMAPEQARGERDVDPRADVFALGCLFHECVSGRPAFAAEHVVALLAKILVDEPPKLRELGIVVPLGLDELLGRMLAKDREARPADGAAVVAQIDALASGSERGAPPDSIDAVPARPTLTRMEQRLLTVMLASVPVARDAGAPREADGPITHVDVVADDTGLHDIATRYRARLERLADGSCVATVTGTGAATDVAATAARCALALRAALGNVPMSLATGRGGVTGRLPFGDVVDRAAGLMGRAQDSAGAVERISQVDGPVRGIRLDEATAGLLDVRFEVSGDAAGLVLVRERESVDVTRTLLGRPTPCVGRDRELGLLHAIFEECASEPVARAVLVTGAAGAGKSRLRHEFLQALRERGERVEIWIARGDSIAAGSALGMLAPALRRAAGVLDGEPLDVQQRKLRARIARSVLEFDRARVSEFVGELAGVPFPEAESVQLRAARQDTLLMGDQMRRAFEDFVIADTEVQPLLIVLEDLHWGDQPTVKFLDGALRRARERAFMVLALARPDVHEVFPALWSERRMQEVRLEPLTRRGVERLVRGVLGDAIASDTIGELVEQSGGNAFLLEELIRAYGEGRGGTLPGSVLAVVQARLQSLDEPARRVLRAASVFGQVFWLGGVLALVGGDHDELGVRERLAALSEREAIANLGAPKFAGEEEFGFRHSLVREAAYAMLTDSDRTLGHRLAGEWLQSVGERDAMRLAEHFERGNDRVSASDCYLRAAREALERNDYDSAIARAERGIACGAGAEKLGHLRLVQAEAYVWRGEIADAGRSATEAMDELRAGDVAWYEACELRYTAAQRLGETDEVRVVGEAVARTQAAPEARSARARVLARLASNMVLIGDLEHAERHLADAVAESECLPDDPARIARLNEARGILALAKGDPHGYVVATAAAAFAFERAGHARNASMQRGNVAYGYIELGAYAEAVELLRNALATAEMLGLRHVVATANHNLGPALARQGKLDEALAAEQRAVEMFHSQQDRRLEGGSRIYVGQILLLRGDLEAAESEVTTAIEILAAHTPLRATAHALRSRVRLRRGDTSRALDDAAEAMRLMESLRAIEEGEALVRLSFAEALAADGRTPEAHRAIAWARDALLARAAKIPDDVWRASFLENVPEHARTLQLATMWLAGDRTPSTYR